MQAGLVLRYRMLLHNSPILIRNRKCGDCVHKMSFFGTEAVNWLTSTTPLVHGRFHAVAMLQALLEEGVIAHGMNWVQFTTRATQNTKIVLFCLFWFLFSPRYDSGLF